MQPKLLYWFAIGVTYVTLLIITKNPADSHTDKFTKPFGYYVSER
jgi:hypothetical protein